MNFFYSLPEEILNIIYNIRDNHVAYKFQKCWKKYHGKKIVAIQLREAIYDYVLPQIEPLVDVMCPHTANVLEYIVKVFSGKEKKSEWLLFIERVEFGLWVDEYTGGPGAPYYIRTDIALDTLKVKLNL